MKKQKEKKENTGYAEDVEEEEDGEEDGEGIEHAQNREGGTKGFIDNTGPRAGKMNHKERLAFLRRLEEAAEEDTTFVLSRIFQELRQPALSSQIPAIKEVMGPASHRKQAEVCTIEPFSFQMPVAAVFGKEDSQALDPSFWGIMAAGEALEESAHEKRIEKAIKTLSTLDNDDSHSLFNRIPKDASRIRDIAHMFVGSSIPFEYLKGFSLLLHAGVPANSAAAVMNQVSSACCAILFETHTHTHTHTKQTYLQKITQTGPQRLYFPGNGGIHSKNLPGCLSERGNAV
jgi:hypothetical protein